jgi:hypothetical protein
VQGFLYSHAVPVEQLTDLRPPRPEVPAAVPIGGNAAQAKAAMANNESSVTGADDDRLVG